MKQEIRLYNMLVPIWLIWLFPPVILIVLPVNFLFDSFILLVGLKLLKAPDKKTIYKKSILKIWVAGFLADIAGALLLSYAFSINFAVSNPFENALTFLVTLLAVGSSGVIIFLLNYRYALRKSNLTDEKRRAVSMILAVFTAPYLYFIPSANFW